jgi:hypothetical protein
LRAQQSIEVTQVQQKEFKEGGLVMMFNVQHHHMTYKKLLPKWFGLFVIKKVFAYNGYYELENVDASPYPDHINHDKLKKVWDL